MSRSYRFRSMRLPRRPWLAVLLVVLLAALAAWQQRYPESFRAASPSDLETGTYRVARVVDGDTIVIVLNGEKERVRLIGANTPETVKPDWPIEPWGPEASQFTKKFLAQGKVRLEFDGQRRDKYDRMLAYVWVDDRMLNEELIRAGLARAEMQYHYSKEMKSRFRRAESEARAAQRGIWSKTENHYTPRGLKCDFFRLPKNVSLLAV
jgi:micrococcal nuclease